MVVAIATIKEAALTGLRDSPDKLGRSTAQAAFVGVGPQARIADGVPDPALASIAHPQLLGNGRDIGETMFLGGLAPATLAALLVLKPLVTAMC